MSGRMSGFVLQGEERRGSSFLALPQSVIHTHTQIHEATALGRYEVSHSFVVSYVEIYLERVQDLLVEVRATLHAMCGSYMCVCVSVMSVRVSVCLVCLSVCLSVRVCVSGQAFSPPLPNHQPSAPHHMPDRATGC